MVQLDGQSRLGARGHQVGAGHTHLNLNVEKFMPHSIPVWMLSDAVAEKTGYPPEPGRPLIDWNLHRDEQRAGRLLFVTSRNQELDLVAFALLFLPRTGSYASVPDDLFYVLPKFRGGGLEEALKAMIQEKFDAAAKS